MTGLVLLVIQQRGHVYIKVLHASGGWGLIAITWTQKCQASLVVIERSEVSMTSRTSTILLRPLTLCNLSTSKQTLSGSWKYKCQVFPHENSCALDPWGKQRPSGYFSSPFSLLPPSSLSWPLLFSISLRSCLCAVAHRTCPLVCRQCCGNVVWQLLRTMATGCFVM